MSGQNVDDNRRRRGAFAQSFGTGGFHCIQPISRDHAQDLHHLAVAVWRVAKLALDTPYRRWQFPFLEGRTIAQSARLAGENRDVVQWVVDGLVAPKSAGVLPDDLAVLPKLDTLSIGADLNRPTNGATVNRVAVFVEPDQAGLRDGCRHGMKAIERADVWHQAGALGLEHFPDCLVSKLLMRMGLGPCQATVLKLCVEIGITLETRPWHEETPPDYANLVLDLPLFPAGGRGAGDRFDKVVPAHLLETPIISTVTANNEIRLGTASETVRLGDGTVVTSDRRDKTDIQDNELGVDFIKKIKTRKFRSNSRELYYKKDPETGRVLMENGLPVVDTEAHERADKAGSRWKRGVVAQEVMADIDPIQFAAVKHSLVNSPNATDEYGVDYTQFVPVLIKAVQELTARVEELERQLSARV